MEDCVEEWVDGETRTRHLTFRFPLSLPFHAFASR